MLRRGRGAGGRNGGQGQGARGEWRNVGGGWDACEDVLRRMGWTQARRVSVMRRARKLDLIIEAKGLGKDHAQAEL